MDYPIVSMSTSSIMQRQKQNTEQMQKIEQLLTKLILNTPENITRQKLPEHITYKFMSEMTEVNHELSIARSTVPETLPYIRTLLEFHARMIEFLAEKVEKDILQKKNDFSRATL